MHFCFQFQILLNLVKTSKVLPQDQHFLRLLLCFLFALSVADSSPVVQPESQQAWHGLIDVLVAVHQGVAKVTHHGGCKVSARSNMISW